MHAGSHDANETHRIIVSDEVRNYLRERKCDFRVCTTCGGPILLPTSVKPPKSTDYELFVDDMTIYISMYQARYIDRIDATMIPRYWQYY
jgi:hypothetical protein